MRYLVATVCLVGIFGCGGPSNQATPTTDKIPPRPTMQPGGATSGGGAGAATSTPASANKAPER